MKSRTSLVSDREITSISFDELDTALIKEVTTPYFEKHSSRYNTSQQASIILLTSMEESDLRQEPLSVDLEPYERPIFVGEMAIAFTMYMEEQMRFWYTLTSRVPRWLDPTTLKMPMGYHESDDFFDPAEDLDLNILERKLEHINTIGMGFKELGEQTNN